MEKQNKSITKELKFTKDKKEFQRIMEEILDTEAVIKLIEQNHYQKVEEQMDNADVNINHLENIFTNETYYAAMKIVPLLERKVLYLSYIENLRLNDICKRLKLQKNQVIRLRSQAIHHFKNNLATLYKFDKVSKGGVKKWVEQL